MKRILMLLLILSLACCFMLVGCDKTDIPELDEEVTDGDNDTTDAVLSYNFGDITMSVGQTVPLLRTISDGNTTKSLTYTADAAQISIASYVMTANAISSGVTVTVSAEGFTATFKVKVVAKDVTQETVSYGQLTVSYPEKIYTNYPGKALTATFSNPDYSSVVMYSTDNDRVFIENGKIVARGEFPTEEIVTVTAQSLYHKQTFTVKVATYTARSAETKVSWYERQIINSQNKGGIIFVGDSYFDGYLGTDGKPPFWKEFATDLAGENAHLLGLSSSRIDNLEMVSERVVYPMEPAEIVVHIGFNDVHDGIAQNLSDSEANAKVDDLATRIAALLSEYKKRLPNVRVYYLGVEAKRSASSTKDGTTSAHYNSTYKYAPRLSDKMKTFADANEWCTFVDTGALTYNSDRTDVVTTYYGDNSHLSVSGYQELMRLLNAERAKHPIEPNVKDFSIANSSAAIQDTAQYIKYMGQSLTKDYVISGSVSINAFTKNNSHMQFRLGASYRFLLWDNNSDGILGVGWTSNGTNVNELNSGVSKTLALTQGTATKFTFTVAVTDNEAYFYIDGTLVATFTGVEASKLQYFNIGASNLGVSVSNITLTPKKYSETDYNAKLTALGITY